MTIIPCEIIEVETGKVIVEETEFMPQHPYAGMLGIQLLSLRDKYGAGYVMDKIKVRKLPQVKKCR